jgi:hypothetical protein
MGKGAYPYGQCFGYSIDAVIQRNPEWNLRYPFPYFASGAPKGFDRKNVEILFDFVRYSAGLLTSLSQLGWIGGRNRTLFLKQSNEVIDIVQFFNR